MLIMSDAVYGRGSSPTTFPAVPAPDAVATTSDTS